MKLLIFVGNNPRHLPASRLAGTMRKFIQEKGADGSRKVVVSFSELDMPEADKLAKSLEAVRLVFGNIGEVKKAIKRFKSEHQYDVVVTVTSNEEAEELYHHYCLEAGILPEMLPKVEWWRGFAFLDMASHVPHYGCVPYAPSIVPPRP